MTKGLTIYGLFFLFVFLSFSAFSQNNAVVLNGAYVVLNGGTSASPIYLVVNQPNASGITRPGGGHIISESDYNFVKWDQGSATGSYEYPFGYSTTDYIPFTFNKTSGDVNLAVSTYHTGQPNLPRANNVSNMIPSGAVSDASDMVIDRYWRLKMEDGGLTAPNGADMTFSYLGSENTIASISCPSDVITAQYWNSPTNTKWVGPGLNPGSACTTSGIGTALASNVSIFTTSSDLPFILTKQAAILPITLVRFSTECNNNKVSVNWSTVSEQNNDFFTIERSADGSNYLPIGKMKSAGNSSSVNNYVFEDTDPLSGTSYYRLRQTDFNGETAIFSSASLSSCGSGGIHVQIGQNPTEGNIWVSITGAENKNVHIGITDMLGQNLYTKDLTGLIGSYLLNTELQLAGGIYVVNATAGSENFSKKIVVVR